MDELGEFDDFEPSVEVRTVALLFFLVEAHPLGEGVGVDVLGLEHRLQVLLEQLAELLVLLLGFEVDTEHVGADCLALSDGGADEVARKGSDEVLDCVVENGVVQEPVLHGLGKRGELVERAEAADRSALLLACCG